MNKLEKKLILLKLELEQKNYGIIVERINKSTFIFRSTKKNFRIEINVDQVNNNKAIFNYYFNYNYYLKSELIDIDKIEWIILYDLVISN